METQTVNPKRYREKKTITIQNELAKVIEIQKVLLNDFIKLSNILNNIMEIVQRNNTKV
jgi:hypothetical protein